uniref:Reverse transcriptase Ty1/copia-type domain-containing protein n=1 Tax=Tanacetum cinerariifolium TaxID=118510 RepID=A0A6L2KA32_TANCI|nr:hypothetical protein [Tanacetum cinerariifolium]
MLRGLTAKGIASIATSSSSVQMIKDEAGNQIEVPPVTAHQILVRTRERKAKSTLLMAIPDEHLARFHKIKDANTLYRLLLKPNLMKVWRLVDLPYEKKAIGTKWGYRNKKDEKGIVVRNKARLDKEYIMLVQVYVDDIIFGSTKKYLCDEFEALMHKGFQMSSMGELTFFLKLHVKQSEEGIFISQDKSMIVSLMYLMASRPDIMVAIYACSMFQITPKLSHLQAVKRIFRYLKGQHKLSLWYPRDSLFDLETYSDSDYDGAILDRKSTTGEPLNDVYVTPTLTNKVFSNMIRKSEKFSRIVTPLFATMLAPPVVVVGKGSGNPLESQPTPYPAQPINESLIPKTSSSPQNTQIPRQTLEGAGTPHTTKTQSKATLNEPTPQGEGSGYTVRSGEDRMKHNIELTDLVPQTPHDSPLSGGHTLEVMRAKEIASLKKRVTKLEQRKSLRFLDKDADKEMIVEDNGNGEKGGSTVETVSTARPDISTARPDISAARPEDSTVEPETPPITITLFDDEDVTIADTLVKMKNQKAKEKRIAFKDTDDSTRPIRSIKTLQPLLTIDLKDKGKGILQESKTVKKSKKVDQDQIERDAKVALKIQADLNEEPRTEREDNKRLLRLL